jgi:hypothetical protein
MVLWNSPIVRRVKYKKIKITTFWKLTLHLSSDEWRGRKDEPPLLGPLDRASLMEAEDGSRASFRNVVILIF